MKFESIINFLNKLIFFCLDRKDKTKQSFEADIYANSIQNAFLSDSSSFLVSRLRTFSDTEYLKHV